MKPKLTAEQIEAVRARAAQERWGFVARSARELGVSRSGLWQILAGQRRRRVEPWNAQAFAARIHAKLEAAAHATETK